MSYITNADIEQRIGTARLTQLTDDSGAGVPDPLVTNEARLGAESEVDSYLARRYAVPIDLTAHPELAGLLISLALDLVEHRLHGRRPPVPEDIVAKRAAAIDWLRRVASGEVELPAAATVAPNAATGPRATTSGETRLLSRDELSLY